MEIIYWNINNRSKAIDLINRSDFNSYKKIVAISEFWDIEDSIKLSSKFGLFSYDFISKRVGLYATDYAFVKLIGSEKYFSLYSFPYRNFKVYLYVVHLKSLKNSKTESLSINSYVIKEISDSIDRNRYDYSIIMGDFNMNNSEFPFLDHFYLNSTNYFTGKEKAWKKFDGKARIKFYNPVNSLIGDLSKGPPGTYFYPVGNQAQAWHSYDNVLISYPLARFVRKDSCEILTEFAKTSLIKNYLRPNSNLSDHLPIRIILE